MVIKGACADQQDIKTRVVHLFCEGVAERKCGNDRSGFYH